MCEQGLTPRVALLLADRYERCRQESESDCERDPIYDSYEPPPHFLIVLRDYQEYERDDTRDGFDLKDKHRDRQQFIRMQGVPPAFL